MKYWEIIADNLSKAGWSWGVSELSILAGERSSLLTRIATTESVSLCVRMKKLTVFMELESAICVSGDAYS